MAKRNNNQSASVWAARRQQATAPYEFSRTNRDDNFGKIVGDGSNNISDKQYGKILDWARENDYGLSDNDVDGLENKYRNAAARYYAATNQAQRDRAVRDASLSAAKLTYVNFHDELRRIAKQTTDWARRSSFPKERTSQTRIERAASGLGEAVADSAFERMARANAAT